MSNVLVFFSFLIHSALSVKKTGHGTLLAVTWLTAHRVLTVPCRCRTGDQEMTTADREGGLGARCRAQPGPTRLGPGAWQPSGTSRRLGARWRRSNTDRDLLGPDIDGSVWCQSG